MLESLLPLCWSNCCVVPFAMADAPPRFFVDPGGCRRERVAPKRPAPRDLCPVVHSAYEDEISKVSAIMNTTHATAFASGEFS